MKKVHILWICALASLISMGGFGYFFAQELAHTRDKRKGDISQELAALIDLADFINLNDRNHNNRVEKGEFEAVALLAKEHDANSDEVVDRRDARPWFKRMLEKSPDGIRVDMEMWSGLGGSRAGFALFDRNSNGEINSDDLHEAAAQAQDVVSGLVDPRNGQRLSLGELRTSWLRRVRAAHREDCLIWKDQLLGRKFFGGGQWARVTPKAGGARVYGFLSPGPTAEKLRLLDERGKLRVYVRSEVDLELISTDSASDWYAAYTSLDAEDAKGWAALAKQLKGGKLNDEALWAARLALLYDVKLVELYPMLGVEFSNGVLKKKGE